MTLKNNILIGILSSVVFIPVANANDNQNNNYYLQLNLGYAAGLKPKEDFPKGNLGKIATYGFEAGYKVSEKFRTGISLDYRPNFKNKYSTTTENEIYRGESSTRTDNYSVKVSSLASMFNIYYDITETSNFIPYITSGVGIARNKTHNYTKYANSSENDPASQLTASNSSKTNFAWKIGLGSKYKINNTFDLDLRYQYVDLGKFTTGKTYVIDGESFEGEALKGKIRSNEILLGITYKF